MKNLIFLILMLGYTLSGAQNLIRNSGFESNYSPPWWAGQYYLCDDWGSSSVWGSPDYYHLNGFGNAQLPEAYASNVMPFEGDAVMGIFVYESHPSTQDFREYLNQELEAPLVIGQRYRLSFYVTNGTGPVTYGGYGCDHFSVAFSTRQLIQPVEDNKYLIDFEPQFTYEGFLYNNDWQLITYEFVADSAYQHLTFGSFVNDSIQKVQLFEEPLESASVNYYIDQVSLEATTAVRHALATNAHIIISPNPVEDQFTVDVENLVVDHLSITDLSGKIIYRETIQNHSGSIDVSCDLLPGIYFVKLQNHEGEFATRKIVKY
jgi:hypothetical protein